MKGLGRGAFVRSNQKMAKRLVLSFPKARDCRVMTVATPLQGHLAFGVHERTAPETGYALFMEVWDTQLGLNTSREQELAVFDEQSDALQALGRVRRAISRPLRRAIGWVIVALLASLIIQWVITVPGTLSPSVAVGNAQNDNASMPISSLSPGQRQVLAEALQARQMGMAGGMAAPNDPALAAEGAAIAERHANGLSAPVVTPPTSGKSAQAVAPAQDNAPTIYSDPRQPDSTGAGALNQLTRAR